jgi:EmrB/QacA subfamily drug resistance transporter
MTVEREVVQALEDQPAGRDTRADWAGAPVPGGHPRRWAILGVLVVSLLVVVLDSTILNVALRVLADPVHGLGATQGELEWSINAYTLVFAGLLFTFGILGDRYGRRRFLLGGLAAFGLASLISAYSQDPAQLIAARALMGVGAAAIMPVTLSIISNVFDPRERGRAIGVWTGAVGLAAAIGPILGGLLLSYYWWGSVFLINVPVVLVGLVAVALLVPESRDPNPGRVDVVGVLLSIVGLVALVYGIIDGGEHGFGRPLVWVAIGGGLAVLALFVLHQLRVPYPSLDVRLFTTPRVAAPMVLVGMVFFAAMGVLFLSSFYFQLVRGYSPLQTGALFLPFAAAQLLFAPRSAALVHRWGPRAVATAGLILTIVGLGSYALFTADTSLWLVGTAIFLQGVGMAGIMPPATELIMSALPREKAGVGSAVSNTMRQVAGALGLAVLGSVLAAVYRDRIGGAVGSLPDPVREAATESIAGAHGAAELLGPAGADLVAAADTAFLTAMHVTAGVGAGFATLGILVVLRWMPRRVENVQL